MKSNAIKYILALTFLLFAALFAISIGSVYVPIMDIIKIVGREAFNLPIGSDVESMYVSIVYDIRLPRVILAGLVGASLAIAGAAFQGLLRNPLAEPYILGVSSGCICRGCLYSVLWHFSSSDRHLHITFFKYFNSVGDDFDCALTLPGRLIEQCVWKRLF